MINSSIHGMQSIEGIVAGTAASEYGVQVTADASTAHTKGAWVELIASTSYPSYGITITLSNIGTTASTNYRFLADIGIGANPNEAAFIDNLIGGNTCAWNAASGSANMYHFPIFIPSGVRLSARCQSNVTSKTGYVCIWLHQLPLGNQWYGSRVTTYGANTATSTGVSVAQSTTGYGTTAEITSSCTNAVKYMQLGMDMYTDSTTTTKRGIVRIGIGATPAWIVSDLPFKESTTLETVDFNTVNFMLSHMRFNIPAATRLALATRTTSAENRGWAIYAVD